MGTRTYGKQAVGWLTAIVGVGSIAVTAITSVALLRETDASASSGSDQGYSDQGYSDQGHADQGSDQGFTDPGSGVQQSFGGPISGRSSGS